MSVKVNLLPSEIGAKSRAGAQRSALIGAFGVLLLLIGGGWWFNDGRVQDAEDGLAAAEAEVATLRAAVAELQPFADLRDRSNAASDLLEVALGHETSVAGILQDLSSVFPPNAELTQLAIALEAEEEAPLPGGERTVYGTVTGSGQLLLGVAPGAERLLIDLDRAAAFDNVFVTMAVDEEDVGAFQFDFQLGPEVLTNRYTSTDAGGMQ